jgi:hypothetical protein
MLLQIFKQPVRMNYDPVSDRKGIFKLPAKSMTLPVGKVFFLKQRITEGQTGGDSMLQHITGKMGESSPPEVAIHMFQDKAHNSTSFCLH